MSEMSEAVYSGMDQEWHLYGGEASHESSMAGVNLKMIKEDKIIVSELFHICFHCGNKSDELTRTPEGYLLCPKCLRFYIRSIIREVGLGLRFTP